MESKRDKEKGRQRGQFIGKNRILKEIEGFKELMYRGSNEKFGKMEIVLFRRYKLFPKGNSSEWLHSPGCDHGSG